MREIASTIILCLLFLTVASQILKISNEYNKMKLQNLNSFHGSCSLYFQSSLSLLSCSAVCNQELNCIYFHFVKNTLHCVLCIKGAPSQHKHLTIAPTSLHLTLDDIMYKVNAALNCSESFRFGENGEQSYWLINTPSGIKKESRLHLSFSTEAINGVLMYGYGSGGYPEDMYAIFISNGFANFAVDTGQGVGVVTTTKKYNDGKWHVLEAFRRFQNMELTVDDEVVNGKSQGTSKSSDLVNIMGFGGVWNSQSNSSAQKSIVNNLGYYISVVIYFRNNTLLLKLTF